MGWCFSREEDPVLTATEAYSFKTQKINSYTDKCCDVPTVETVKTHEVNRVLSARGQTETAQETLGQREENSLTKKDEECTSSESENSHDEANLEVVYAAAMAKPHVIADKEDLAQVQPAIFVQSSERHADDPTLVAPSSTDSEEEASRMNPTLVAPSSTDSEEEASRMNRDQMSIQPAFEPAEENEYPIRETVHVQNENSKASYLEVALHPPSAEACEHVIPGSVPILNEQISDEPITVHLPDTPHEDLHTKKSRRKKRKGKKGSN